MTEIPITLTIAGSDSGGGAGIQADLKSIAANRAYGASVITALTAQNTVGVSGVHDVPPDFILAQMDAVFTDLNIASAKIGMLSQIAVIETVAAGLGKYKAENIVLDPVMVATSGDALLADDAVTAIGEILVPMADLITPNLHEASKLTGLPFAADRRAMIRQGEAMIASGAKAVLIKGGHGNGKESSDLLIADGQQTWFHSPRIDTQNTHGTGCSLSSAIAAQLAHGVNLLTAVEQAKTWLTGAIIAADQLSVGKGSGPVNHFHALWSR